MTGVGGASVGTQIDLQLGLYQAYKCVTTLLTPSTTPSVWADMH